MIKKSLLFGVLFLGYIITLQHGAPVYADILDITIIPTDGKVGEAFRTGDFSFEVLLLYGMYLIKIMALVSGSLYVVMNVVAGIQYILSETVTKKEAGKNTLMNAFQGFALTTFAWIIIDVVIAFFSES